MGQTGSALSSTVEMTLIVEGKLKEMSFDSVQWELN